MAMSSEPPATAHRLGVIRFAVTGALSAGLFYILCWIGAQLPIGSATHMFLRLFTNADLSSTDALLRGALWSLAFGLIAGGLIAAIYNALGRLDRR